MTKFEYGDLVRVVCAGHENLRQGAKASIVGIFREKVPGNYFQQFPEGTIYSIEFEDGAATEVHESGLALCED